MPYRVIEAQQSDIPDIAACCHAAFAPDPIVGLFMKDVAEDARVAYDEGYWRQQFNLVHLNGMRVFKAVDENGSFAGVAKWQFPYTLTSEQVSEKEAAVESGKKRNPLPEKANKALMEEFIGALANNRKKYIDESKDYFVHILTVQPSHQRKGVGDALLREGLSSVDAEEAICYIEASKFGLGLYLKHGWRPIDEIAVDMTKYGGSTIEVEPLLVRDAKRS